MRHLLVRRAVKTGEILVALVTSTQTEGLNESEEMLIQGWKETLLGLDLEGSYAGILQIHNDSLAVWCRVTRPWCFTDRNISMRNC